jgi:outer membrane protein, heavy metal efflux system
MQRRAKLESYPMIGVGLEVMGSNYIMGMGSDRVPIVAQFRVTLPIWRARYHAAIKQAAAEAKVVQYNKADVNQRIQSETGILFANYNEADERVKLYKERLIPRSRELTDLMLLDYSSGRVRLDDVITARRQSVDYAISLERAVFDRNMIVAQFEQLVALETQEK